jgi:heme exporter protein A
MPAVMAEVGLTTAGLAVARGARLLLADLDVAVGPGGHLRLIGANGCGKSSLLRVLATLAPPTAGSIRWDGRPIADDLDAHRRRLAFIGHGEAIKPTLTARENLVFHCRLASGSTADVDTALDRLGLDGLGDRPGRVLSSGQRRRLSLARLACRSATLWLLDEPTVGLDPDGVRRFADLLASHLGAGGVAVIASHLDLGVPADATLSLVDHRPRAGDLERLDAEGAWAL